MLLGPKGGRYHLWAEHDLDVHPRLHREWRHSLAIRVDGADRRQGSIQLASQSPQDRLEETGIPWVNGQMEGSTGTAMRVHVHPAETPLAVPAIDHRVATDVRRH